MGTNHLFLIVFFSLECYYIYADTFTRNLFVADTANHVIRMVTAAFRILKTYSTGMIPHSINIRSAEKSETVSIATIDTSLINYLIHDCRLKNHLEIISAWRARLRSVHRT